MTDQDTDRSGLCDHCTKPSTGGAAGGGLPPQHWCDDHAPDDFYFAGLIDNEPDPVDEAREKNAALVARLRAMADAIERLDAVEPLPPVYCSATLYLFEGPEDERVRGVIRLNTALGNGEHETSDTPQPDGRRSFRPKGVHEGYAFTLLEVDARVSA